MNKKQIFFSLAAGAMVSMVIGAGGMYLANFKKINFMNRYPVILELEKFVDETLEIGLPPNEDEETIVNAYLALYGDKYTKYEAPVDIFSKEFIVKETNESSVALGSGFQIDFDENDNLYIASVTEGMAADKQGLIAGDIIKAIDGNEIVEFKNAKKIRGEDGTTVSLLIERNGIEKELEFIRSCDTMKTTGISRKMYGDTLYLKLDEIGWLMSESVHEAFQQDKFNTLILDLRNNGGGYTQIALEISDLFISEGKVVTHAKNGEKSTLSVSENVTYDVPVVILVNEKTASASELIAALLKQYGNATIVGTQTFGKAIYQLESFFKGGTLTYTDGYVTVGDWECYHGIGIEPDVEIPMDSALIGTENDIQLEKALELVK